MQPDHEIHFFRKYRWIENGHIFLWLIKDTCWALEFKSGGIFMIFPTISVALFIVWKSKKIRSEFFHNIAVCLWIIANSAWMIGEFYEKDVRSFAVVLFAAGLTLLIYYYVRYFKTDQKKKRELLLALLKKKKEQNILAEAEIND